MAIEMSKGRKFLFTIASFLTAFAVMGEMGVLPFVYNLYGTFPESPLAVNYIISSAALWMVGASFACVFLMRKFTKKTLLTIGAAIFCVGGIVPGFVGSIPVVMTCRSLMGIGEGMVNTIIMAMIAAIYVDEGQRAAFMGYWNAASAVISTVMSAVSGVLAASNWMHGFWIYIPGIVMVIAIILFIPNVDALDSMLNEGAENYGRTEDGAKHPLGKLYWFFLIDYLLFTIIYGVQSYFVSAYVAEAGLGDSAMAGFCTSASTVGSFVICLLFGKIYGKLRKSTALYLIAIQGIMMVIMYFCRTTAIAYIGSAVIGACYGAYFSYSYAYVPEILPFERINDGISFTTGFYGLAFFLCTYIFTAVQNIFGIVGAFTPLYLIFGMVSIVPLVLEILTMKAYKEYSANNQQ